VQICEEHILITAMAPPAISCQAEAATITSATVYSKESEQLVKKSWDILKKDAQRNGINFFRKVFEIAPGAKAMYSFMRDSTIPFEENPKVKNHARSVFLMTGDAAIQLGEKGTYQVLDSRLQKLAATHINAGVTDDQFEVTTIVNLYTVKVFIRMIICRFDLILNYITGDVTHSVINSRLARRL
jgi:hemoglobin-like flavoprotein